MSESDGLDACPWGRWIKPPNAREKTMLSLVAAKRSRLVNRRQWLQLGGMGAAALSLPQLLRAEAAQRTADKKSKPGSAKNCIYIFLCGGPSQLDMWDLKPTAPEDIRGAFKPIATSVPGIQIGELLPQVAKHADKLAIIRSMTHNDPDHSGGIAHTLLAQKPARRNDFYVSRQDHPALGAILHKLQGDCGGLPPWVIVPRIFSTLSPPHKGQSAGFLGAAFDPIALNLEKRDSLADKELKLDALLLPEDMTAARLDDRRKLLPTASNAGHDLGGTMAAWGSYYETAFSMLSGSTCRRAFDLGQEPPALRERYGRNEYGQSFLLARRLVESGVRVVNVFWTYFDPQGCQFNLWDNHGVIGDADVCGTGGARTGLDMIKHPYCCPSFDRAFSALLEDLQQRGLLAETLVAVVGEFGRTPKINPQAGRDHWPHCYSQLLAGGGIRGGQIYGASDQHAAYVKELPVSPDDFGATILHAFGLAPETLIHDPLNRPLPICDGRPLTSLFG